MTEPAAAISKPRRWRWAVTACLLLLVTTLIVQTLQAANDSSATTATDANATDKPTPLLDLNLTHDQNAWKIVGAIMVATYILEDPTTIAVGLLIKDGQLDFTLGVFALFVGIFSGDLGLYLIGRFAGRPALKWKFVANRLPMHRVDRLGKWFDRHGWTAVLTSRFIPGSRMPLYIAAGALGNHPWRFCLWTLLAVSIWAPTMLMIVIVLGKAAASPLQLIFGAGWFAVIAAVIVLLFLLRTFTLLLTFVGRQQLKARWARLFRHEFWPAWIFYLPLVPYLIYLSIRHRSVTVFTLANPAIPLGGWVGESKNEILTDLKSEHTLPWVFIPTASPDTRLKDAKEKLAAASITYPMIAKPDAGQRGTGVKLVHDQTELADYLTEQPAEVMLQTFHPGPYEAGVFYYRYPDEPTGHIYSITDKVFPVITGNGKHTLEKLIWHHPRYRMQAAIYLRRMENQRDDVLAKGKTLSLGMAGNHCQGTLFRDGAHLITPALVKKIDEIAKSYDGFYFGRFDVRYGDVEKFKAGEDLAIIEVNGVSSESTNLYDPSWSARQAYRVLFGQWHHLYAIGHANQKAHGPPPGILQLIATTWHYYRQRNVVMPAD